MEQTQTKQNGRPKVDLKLGEIAKLTLLKDKCYAGESSYGSYYLYNVRNEAGVELSFFAPPDVHAMILEAQLKAGDSFRLTKKAVQNGKKVSAKMEFESLKKQEPVRAAPQPRQDEVPAATPEDDRYRQLMVWSLRDAIEATKAVNTVQWDVDSIRGIALTIFIQRARG